LFISNQKRTLWPKASKKVIEKSKKPKKRKDQDDSGSTGQKGVTAGWQPTFGSGKKK
jgi:hypothetical protein